MKEHFILEAILLTIFVFSLGIAAGFLIGHFLEYELVYPFVIPKSNVMPNCSNQSTLSATIECFNNEYSKWIVYNISNGYFKGIKDLKEKGGNCNSMMLLWNATLTRLGYPTQAVYMFPNGNGAGHTFLVSWNTLGGNLSEYCTCDLLDYRCYQFEENIPV
jgi:hypothetical protein